jgi:hypothetical protein
VETELANGLQGLGLGGVGVLVLFVLRTTFRLAKRLDALSSRLDAMGRRVDALSERADALSARIDAAEE